MWTKIRVIIFIAMSISSFAFSWDGYDYDSGSYVEIEKGNLVRSGEEIEYYDYDSGEYKYADVESINSLGSSAEVEVYDSDTDTYRTFEMDGHTSSYTPNYVPIETIQSAETSQKTIKYTNENSLNNLSSTELNCH